MGSGRLADDKGDLIPRFVAFCRDGGARNSATDAAGATELGLADGSDAMAAAGHAALIILYDDDILASDGMIL